MSRPRGGQPSVDRRADVIAVGSPPLAVADGDHEQLEDLVAEVLIAALERDGESAR
jgi:hypothetical protein